MLDTVNTGAILKKYDLRLTKSLGQNFLTDINIIDKIVEAGEVSSEDLVLEIGTWNRLHDPAAGEGRRTGRGR